MMLDVPAPMHALAERLSCDQSYVTGLATDLEARGLVTREPGDDRRVRVLTPTQSGIALRGDLARALGERSRLLNRLTQGDRAELRRILTALLRDQT